MDPQAIWIVSLSIATPIAGVVGFAIQLRQIKKVRLENQKLQLEISALETRAIEADRRIVLASNEEVIRITRDDLPRFSIRGDAKPIERIPPSLKENLFVGAILVIALLFAGYLLYDIYRLFIWVSSNLSFNTE